MRAKTKGKHEIGRRFAIVIGVAAVGVMALGAQTALAGGESVDSTPPDLQLSGPKKQSPQNARPCAPPVTEICGDAELEVRVSCDEVCTVRVTGKLTNVKMDKLHPVGAEDLMPRTPWGPPEIGPELGKEAQRKQVRQALDEGKNVKAKVTVRATDAAGNVATAKRTITLVK
jgi:hypothetical protein